ncbi:hypothetical protein [Pelagibacterium lentulum]|uniref:Uncharacterized protein n=1 Tax=Pelagibacterium lentulum TaxID=2029865 RepID=A0A916RF72_9HYPH|nr:hypothetical protein [Pelagibacterium lentulum]GGA54216.1 hypothetical protein GCM10011499_25470 [Pelagibacterium lentulum]
MSKAKTSKLAKPEADQVFRQFAWNLAGRLKQDGAGTRPIRGKAESAGKKALG